MINHQKSFFKVLSGFCLMLLVALMMNSCTRKDPRYVFINKKGDIVLDDHYNFANIFSEGLAYIEIKVNKHEFKSCFIDRTGKIVLELKKGKLEKYSKGFSGGRALIKSWEPFKYKFINKAGKTVIDSLDRAWDFSDGLANVTFNKTNKLSYSYAGDSLLTFTGGFVFIDTMGKIVLNPKGYTNISNFAEGLAVAYIWGEKFTYIDKTDKTMMVGEDYINLSTFSEGLAGVQTKDGQWGYIDKTWKMIIKPQEFEDEGLFSEGLAWVEVKDKTTNEMKFGYIDKTGKMVIKPEKYSQVGDFSEGLAWVNIKDSTKNNNPDNDNDEFPVKYGFIDKTGKVVLNIQYGFAGDFKNGLAPVVIK